MGLDANRWNRIRYGAYAPVYGWLVWPLRGMRRRSIERLDPRPGERLLLVGAGPGPDLAMLPPAVEVHAVDASAAMVSRARSRGRRLRRPCHALQMDGQRLGYADACFDAAALHLILAVVPDPRRCLREVARVLRPGGRAVVLDKFLGDREEPAAWRKALNPLAAALASDLNRRLGPMLVGTGLAIEHQEHADRRGFFRMALLRRQPTPPPVDGGPCTTGPR